jgi:hypothetical protein
MKMPLRGKPTTVATYAIGVIIFGVLVSKIFEKELLQSGFGDALTIALLVALAIIAWITGWMKGQDS